ncbi:MAG: hypothetical protein Q6367_000170 [Candidatus Freyarchaeota archaeon]
MDIKVYWVKQFLLNPFIFISKDCIIEIENENMKKFYFLFSILVIFLIAIISLLQKTNKISAQECGIGNCSFCLTKEECLGAGCEWNIEGYCTKSTGPPPPQPSPDCVESMVPFEWGTIEAKVNGNQVTIHNTSEYAWAVHRTSDGCHPPPVNEPPSHQADETYSVKYRLDGGNWRELFKFTNWGPHTKCSRDESTCGYWCCRNTYDLSFTLSNLSAGDHSVEIKVEGAYPMRGEWSYVKDLFFTIVPECNCSEKGY